jgi:hypothetical protein
MAAFWSASKVLSTETKSAEQGGLVVNRDTFHWMENMSTLQANMSILQNDVRAFIFRLMSGRISSFF